MASSSQGDHFSYVLESSPVHVSGNRHMDCQLSIEETKGVDNGKIHFNYHSELIQPFVSSSLFGVAFSASHLNRCSSPSRVKFYLAMEKITSGTSMQIERRTPHFHHRPHRFHSINVHRHRRRQKFFYQSFAANKHDRNSVDDDSVIFLSEFEL